MLSAHYKEGEKEERTRISIFYFNKIFTRRNQKKIIFSFFLLLIYEAIRLDRPVLEEDSICCCVEIFVRCNNTAQFVPLKIVVLGFIREDNHHILWYIVYTLGWVVVILFRLPFHLVDVSLLSMVR
jgi:hypothetical protein